MTTSTSKPTLGELEASLAAHDEELGRLVAERAEMAGLVVLGEADQSTLDTLDARIEALEHVANAAESGVAILRARAAQADEERAAARLDELRDESNEINRANRRGAATFAKVGRGVGEGLAQRDALAARQAEINRELEEADPATAAAVDADARAAMDDATKRYREAQAAIRSEAERIVAAIKSINPWANPSDFFTNRPIILSPIEPDAEPEIVERMRANEALAKVAAWRNACLAAALRDYAARRAGAVAAHRGAHASGGLGHLPPTDADLRNALAFDEETYLRLMPDSLARTLTLATQYLPDNPADRYRADPFEWARQVEALSNLRRALRSLPWE